jgi:hypothetical protein
VFLRWNQCYGDGGVQNKTFACGTNAGAEVLTGGFALGADLAQVSGNEVTLELASAGAVLPAWWEFKNAGTCRPTAMIISFSIDPLASVCQDWAQGLSSGGILAYNIGVKGPNTARMVAALAVAPENLQNLSAGQEYFSFSLRISHTKTVGTGACAGCTTPVCLLLRSINVTTPVVVNNQTLSGPGNGVDSDFATWQGGGGISSIIGSGCPGALPVEKRTWGAVKALYL